jgi:hypothetical protein
MILGRFLIPLQRLLPAPEHPLRLAKHPVDLAAEVLVERGLDAGPERFAGVVVVGEFHDGGARRGPVRGRRRGGRRVRRRSRGLGRIRPPLAGRLGVRRRLFLPIERPENPVSVRRAKREGDPRPLRREGEAVRLPGRPLARLARVRERRIAQGERHESLRSLRSVERPDVEAAQGALQSAERGPARIGRDRHPLGQRERRAFRLQADPEEGARLAVEGDRHRLRAERHDAGQAPAYERSERVAER